MSPIYERPNLLLSELMGHWKRHWDSCNCASAARSWCAVGRVHGNSISIGSKDNISISTLLSNVSQRCRAHTDGLKRLTPFLGSESATGRSTRSDMCLRHRHASDVEIGARHGRQPSFAARPLHTRKRTCRARVVMSRKGQGADMRLLQPTLRTLAASTANELPQAVDVAPIRARKDLFFC
jgi:hypothetical protein